VHSDDIGQAYRLAVTRDVRGAFHRRPPVMDTGRARAELGWTPRVRAVDALAELLQDIPAARRVTRPRSLRSAYACTNRRRSRSIRP